MSLDVYLETDQVFLEMPKICIRENGQNRKISREEWDERFPGREPIIVEIRETNEVYTANITHNLNEMAERAGIYRHLWRPDEIGISTARQLIEPLQAGLQMLEESPGYFKRFNPPNKWGSYEGLVKFVRNYLAACEQWPDASVSVWR